MRRIYFTGQHNFGNRGCEALVRSTVGMLGARFGEVDCRVPSTDPAADLRQWPEATASGVSFVAAPPVSQAYRWWGRACRMLPPVRRLRWPAMGLAPAVRSEIEAADLVLSIGGDNYSLDYGLVSLFTFVGIAEAAMAAGKPAVLWGVSAGPFDAEPRIIPQVRDHLQRLALVTARESFSYDYLKGYGLNGSLVAVTDPAFALQPEAVDADRFWPRDAGGGVLGLNISPLIRHYRTERDGHTLAGEVAGFIRACVGDFGLSVLLVPHVVPLDGSPVNNDADYLADIHARVNDLGPRVTLADRTLNAAQLKHVIGRCRYFIGARMHSTVAALSQGVPTISIAYSVKSKGINQDLFGHTRYVLDTPAVSGETLTAALELAVREEALIRQRLREAMPEWRARAARGTEALASIATASR